MLTSVKQKIRDEHQEDGVELQSMMINNPEQLFEFNVIQQKQPQRRKSARPSSVHTPSMKMFYSAILMLLIISVSIVVWTSVHHTKTKNTINKQKQNNHIESNDSNNDGEIIIDYHESEDESAPQSIEISNSDNKTARLPQLRSHVEHKRASAPDAIGHVNIYIREDPDDHHRPPTRLRFPVARYIRRRNPFHGPFLRHLPAAPILVHRSTQQTLIYSRSAGSVYVIPPLVTDKRRLFSVAELLASGYASLQKDGQTSSDAIDIKDYYQPIPVRGAKIPSINSYHGGFNGGLRTNYHSFSIPEKYRHPSETYSYTDTKEEDTDNYNYSPPIRRRPIKELIQKPIKTDDSSTTTVLQPFIDQILKELNSESMDSILYWNLVTIEAAAYDFNTDIAATPDQPGPTFTSRAFAIIHGAMYEAVVVFHGVYKSFYKPLDMPSIDGVHKKTAIDAAVMEAAYQTLYALYQKQRPIFDGIRHDFLKRLKLSSNAYHSAAVEKGIVIGKLIAQFILAQRGNDGSAATINYQPIQNPGYHQVDPLHPNQGFLGPHWGSVKPFFIPSASPFHPPNNLGADPAARLNFLNSEKYVSDYEEVRSFGRKVSSSRTTDQEEIGIFWAYDGAPKIGTPPRLYNQVVRVVAIQQKNTLIDNARLFAMVNYGMGDAAIVAWDVKYFYNLWRPIVGIRAGGGATIGEPDWEPLGSPSDGRGTDFTPNFPAYVSGHSTFGSTCFETLRRFYGKDDINFRFKSDEFNGRTIDSRTNEVRPVRIRTYQSFTQAETENSRSRIYLGVHWGIDAEDGRIIGENVAKFVFEVLSAAVMDFNVNV